MPTDPTRDRPEKHSGDTPDEGTREVLEEAAEDVELPRGATPETPQHRSSAEQLDKAKGEQRDES